MQPSDIEPFLSHLAIERSTAVNTQRTALNALVFLFREFLKQEIGELEFQQANKPRKLPTVLSQDEAKEPLNNSPRALRELKRSATRRTSQRNGRSPCQEVQRRGRTF
jgi:site-specific recombinase XerD